MRSNFQRALEITLNYEGGWSDHPDDPGGATMKGVTLKTYSDHIGRAASKDELKEISDEEIQAIYRGNFWNLVRADDVPSGVDLAMFDFAVNSGPKRAILTAQSIVFAEQDGVFGPQTLKKLWEWIATYGSESFVKEYCKARGEFLRGLATFGTFGKGWNTRVLGVEAEACKIAQTELV